MRTFYNKLQLFLPRNTLGNQYLKYLGIFCMFILVACAQVRTIPGGEKDVLPPVVLMSEPPPLTTQFNAKEIILFFDEYVQLNNIQQELIVSPPLPHSPKVRVKQKSVVIQLQDSLLPNTTYMFNFGDGIADINEGNKAVDLIYVFSTGNSIDSLNVKGHVFDALTSGPAKSFKVLLFDNDTAVFTKKSVPHYFAKSKDDGSFKLPYLSEGQFFMYAIDDLNSNYIWDEGESYAAFETPIKTHLHDSTDYELIASTPRPTTPYVDSYVVDSVGSVRFAWDSFYEGLRIKSLAGLSVYQNTIEDSVYAYIQGKPTDRMEELEVSCGNILSDTIRIPFYNEAAKAPLKLTVNAGKKMKSTDEIIISSDRIFSLNNPNAIEFLQDSTPVQVNWKALPDSTKCKAQIALLAGKKYQLRLFPNAFTSQNQATNDSLEISFETYKTEDLGTILFNLTECDSISFGRLVVLNKENETVFELENIQNGIVSISNLPSGDYTARILEDIIKNKKFDPAVPIEHIKPERIHVYPGKISVRSNWEVKLDWHLNKMN
jgi:hypothetical protein